MLPGTVIFLLSLAYLGLLFAIAYIGDRLPAGWYRGRRATLIYALSLAIYCTSWTFYGSVGRAATVGLDFILIYVGPVIVITLGYPVMRKMVEIARRQNVTSIADFLGSRYGKSRAVAVLATLTAVIGVLPYIALQMQAVTVTFEALAGAEVAHLIDAALPPPWRDTTMFVAGIMALFTILFGVRDLQATEQHRGMMLAIAFESLVKLAALLSIGGFVVFGLYDGPGALFDRLAEHPDFMAQVSGGFGASWLPMTLLAGLAFLCLPRQFHVAVVEHGDANTLKSARWLFPLYLVAINLFVVPIAAAGLLGSAPGTNPDLYVLTLPLQAGGNNLAVFGFIGGLSAATSMVIVACMALSIMVSNELFTPLLLRSEAGGSQTVGRLVLNVRRGAVVVILVLAYIYHSWIAGYLPLASIGMISFCAVANFGPALLLGLYWRRAHRSGVIAGLVAAFTLWLYTLLLPSIEGAAQGGRMLAPLARFLPEPVASFDPVLQGFIVCQIANLLLLVGLSLLAKPKNRDRQQAEIYVGGGQAPLPLAEEPEAERDDPRIEQLRNLAARFLGEERVRNAFAGRRMTFAEAAAFTEHLLSGAIGAASARIVIASLQAKGMLSPRAARTILGEATEAIRQNLDLLRATLDHIGQGIGVFDAERKLATWNQRFFDLLQLPQAHAEIGMPADKLTGGAIAGLADMLTLASGRARRYETRRADGVVVETRIDPMPDGGFVATCTDITERVRAAELERARIEAETANLGKTRFIAAASHDLLQPLHATRLFTAALREREPENEIVARIDQGLGNVEALLDALLDISKLDAGAVKPELRAIALGPLLESVAMGFAPVAAQRGVTIKVPPSSLNAECDPGLLRRVLQNFVSNALRYMKPEGERKRVLIGCRRLGRRIRIEVWDNGIGIPEDKRAFIFKEFARLDERMPDGGERGLGLGLAIVERISSMLGAPLGLRSRLGQGSVFSIMLPRAAESAEAALPAAPMPIGAPVNLEGLLVLCIDNEARVREAMTALLEGWDCRILAAEGLDAARQLVAQAGRLPDIILADLHLSNQPEDSGPDGLDAILRLRQEWGRAVPAVLITADRAQGLRQRCRAANADLLHKPVRPAALRALITQRVRPFAKLADTGD